MKIVNKTYNLKSTIIKTNIVLISDIHYYDKNDIKQLNKVLDNIKNIKPKFICISGDIIDQSNIEKKEEFINWLGKLSKISKVVISIGNHEFYINKKDKKFGLDKELFKKIKSINNLYLLDNENIIIDNINFIGLTLPINYYEYNNNLNDFKKYLKYIKTYNNCYNVLLCHCPIDISNKEILDNLNIDLLLCGHMHGGITPRIIRPILKNRGLISPQKTLFPKIAYGYLKVANTDIVITSGIRVVSHSNNFKIIKNFFSSEIVEIKINS